jgi:glycogen synthase
MRTRPFCIISRDQPLLYSHLTTRLRQKPAGVEIETILDRRRREARSDSERASDRRRHPAIDGALETSGFAVVVPDLAQPGGSDPHCLGQMIARIAVACRQEHSAKSGLAPPFLEALVTRAAAAHDSAARGNTAVSGGDSGERRPRWLFVAAWPPYSSGGVNQVIINLARTLDRRGVLSPCVLVSDWERRTLVSVPGSSGIEARYRMRSPWNPRHPVNNAIAFVRELPGVLMTLVRLVRLNRVAVINPHYPTLGCFLFTIMRAVGLARFRLVISLHGADVRKAKETGRIERALWSVLLSSADAVVACSEHLANEVRDAFPKARSRVVAVCNGIDPQTFLAERDSTFSLPKDLAGHPYLLTVASFEQKKGLDVLVEALSQLVARFQDLRLAIVGQDGPERPAIQALVESLGLSSRVHTFVNLPHSSIPVVMERARAFVLPSRIEPFGLVLLEAGACFVPVVATTAGGIPEFVQHGVSGLLVKPDNPSELASAIAQLLDSPELACRLVIASWDRMTSQFSWERAVDQYLSLACPELGSDKIDVR